jgi:UDP-N-acetylmuramyl pentapeptide phosphotransferase/UDP-N-acetylglucosamine-1-phosphate transferase
MIFSILFIISFAASLMGVSMFREHYGSHLIDIPNERSSHTRPTPRGGGLIVVGITLAGGLFYAFVLQQSVEYRLAVLVYTAVASVLAMIGWLDDLSSLSNRVRFMVHSAAAVVMIGYFGYYHSFHLPFFGALNLGPAGLPLTFLWIVGLTNAYNFMDGIDGIAGGQAVVAGFAWAVLGGVNGQPMILLFGLLLSAGSLGFLYHNWPPAKIFMGDVGSSFLGFTFSVLPLMLGFLVKNEKTAGDLPLTAFLIVCPFVFDTGFTLLRRLRRGENIFVAHRSHLYQRLVIAGRTHLSVTLLYSCLALFYSTLGILHSQGHREIDTLIALIVPFFCFTLWAYVVQKEHRRRQIQERLHARLRETDQLDVSE